MMLDREYITNSDSKPSGSARSRQMAGHDRHIGAAGLGQHVERNADFHDILLLRLWAGPAPRVPRLREGRLFETAAEPVLGPAAGRIPWAASSG
jgi:hypothetical protein